MSLSWRTSLTVCLLLTALGTLVYANHLRNPFQFDSVEHIEGNPLLDHPARMLTLGFLQKEFWSRGVLRMSFALNAFAGKKDVLGYRLVNLILHVMNAALAFFVLRRLFGHFFADADPVFSAPTRTRTALFAALLFLLHPIQTEAVGCVVHRSEVLTATLYLAGFLVFQSALAPGVPAWRRFGAVPIVLLAAFGIGFSVKQTMVTFPAMLALYYLCLQAPGSRVLIFLYRGRWLLTAVALAGLAVLLRKLLTDESFLIGPSTAGDWVGRKTYMLSQPSVVVFYYLKQLLAPVSLNIDPHIPPVETLFAWRFWVPALCLLCVCAVAYRNKTTRLYFFLTAWFFVVLLPSSSIVTLHDLAAEHRVYLAGLGFFAAVAVVGARALAANRLYSMTGAILVLLGLSALTVERNLDWSSRLRLWTDAARKSPDKARPYINLGKAYYEDGRLTTAIEQFRRSIALYPLFPLSHYNLGNVYLDVKFYADAEREYRQVLQLQPDHVEGRIGLGSVYNAQGRYAEAEAEYRRAVETANERQAAERDLARLNLGEVYGKTGRQSEALDQWRQIDTAYRDKARFNMGVAYTLLGDFANAERAYLSALEETPDMPQALYNLARLYQVTRQWDRSSAAFEKYLLTAKDDARALTGIGWNREQNGQWQEAERFYRRALMADPAYPSARFNLANLYLAQGKAQEAIAEFDAVVRQLPDDPEMHRQIGLALWRAGKNREAALRHLHTAKRLFGAHRATEDIDRLIAQIAAS
jgi:tetratricopeptide (TPR) repeat protein